jgi:phytoene dehydrogenase-like protein
MDAYDAVIIGSGHNALVTGAYLARDGWSVLVLEGRPAGRAGPAFAELGPELAAHGLEYVRQRYFSGVSVAGEGATVFSSLPEENVAEAELLAPGDGEAC